MTRPSDRRLLRYARQARAYLAGIVVVTAAVAGLVILQAQLLATAIAGTFSDDLDLSALTGTIAALATVVAARAALAWALEGLSYLASAGVKSQLRRDLLRRSVELGPRWLATRRAGELATLATVGVDALDGYFAKYLPQVALAVVIPLAVVARLLAADPLSAAIIVVTLPLILPGVIAGMILSFAKSMGEFGATITFVSNIPGETQTLPSAIYTLTQVPGGDVGALRLTLVSVVISVAALLGSELLARRIKR